MTKYVCKYPLNKRREEKNKHEIIKSSINVECRSLDVELIVDVRIICDYTVYMEFEVKCREGCMSA